MPDTPAATAPVDSWSLTSAEAGAKLAEMTTAMRPAPPLAPQTPHDAQNRLDALAKDAGFARALFSGDMEANRQFKQLTELAATADSAADALAGTEAPDQIIEVTTNGELPRRHVAAFVDGMREAGIRDEVIQETLSNRPVTAAERQLTLQFQRAKHGDAEWVKRLLSNDYEAKRQWTLMCDILSRPVEG